MNLPIPTTDSPVEFTPLALIESYSAAVDAYSAAVDAYTEAKERGENPKEPKKPPRPAVFLVRPASEIDFEKLGFELFRHNIAPPTQDTFRAAMIDEIFELYGDEEGEEKAGLLDAYWSAEDVYNGEIEAWQVQDRQRRIDEANGAAKRTPEPLPSRTMGLRDRNKATLLAEEMRRKSARLRDMVVEMSSFGPKQSAGIARLTIDGWQNLETPYENVNGIIPEATWDALRKEIGKDATKELIDYASGFAALSTEDVGNSGSPLETAATDAPSPEPSGEPEASDGVSTSAAEDSPSTSTSTPALACESGPGTEEQSNSSSPSTGTTASAGDTPVEATPEPPAG